MNRVLITGASGFVGSQLARHLADAGHLVRGTTRQRRRSSPSIEWLQIPDYLDRYTVRHAVEGVTTLYHLAARVHVRRRSSLQDLQAFREANADATRILAEEAVRAGVRRFVFASTVKVMGEYEGTPFTEAMEPRPSDAYGVTKLEGEEIVRATRTNSDIEHVILRFPLIYGAGMRANMYSLFRQIDRGIPLPFAGIENRRSLLFSRNAVAALVATGESPRSMSETFFVSDGEDVSTEQLVRLIAAGLGTQPRLFRLPAVGVRLAARVGDILSPLVPVPLSTDVANRVFGSLAVDSSKMSRLTGFNPPYSLRDGIAETATWFAGQRR